MDQPFLLKTHIEQRLMELDLNKDMSELSGKGKLSFGMDAKTYGRHPAWKELLRQKKKLMRLVWLNAFMVSLVTIGLTSGLWEKLEQHWTQALTRWIFMSAMVTVFFVIGSYYSVFAQFRRTDHEVRKLIYQDMLQHLEGGGEIEKGLGGRGS